MKRWLFVICILVIQLRVDAVSDNDSLFMQNEFDGDILELVRQMKITPEPLTGVGAGGNSQVAAGISFQATESRALQLVKKFRTRANKLGYQIYVQELGYGYQADRVAIFKSADKFDTLRLRQTFAYDHGLSTEIIIQRLDSWDRQLGVEIIGAGYNWVWVHFDSLPENLGSFGKEILHFCPDVLLFKSGSIDQLVVDLKNDQGVYLFWK